MTRLTEIFEELLVETGEFIVPKDSIELDESKFRLLVKRVLKTHNKYCPRVISTNLNCVKMYTFTDSFEIDNEVVGIPRFVVSAVPRGYGGGTALSGEVDARLKYSGKWSHLIGGKLGERYIHDEPTKTPFPFRWERPTLYTFAETDLIAKLAYDYTVKEDDAETGCKRYYLDYEVANDPTFLKLLAGYFLRSLGRSRAAFTLTDIPLQDDSVDIKAEGKALIDEAEEEYRENRHKFYLAYR